MLSIHSNLLLYNRRPVFPRIEAEGSVLFFFCDIALSKVHNHLLIKEFLLKGRSDPIGFQDISAAFRSCRLSPGDTPCLPLLTLAEGGAALVSLVVPDGLFI